MPDHETTPDGGSVRSVAGNARPGSRDQRALREGADRRAETDTRPGAPGAGEGQEPRATRRTVQEAHCPGREVARGVREDRAAKPSVDRGPGPDAADLR